jgi:hypothetical protein
MTEITLLVNQCRQILDGEWVDAEPTRHVVRAFNILTLTYGDRLQIN